MNLESLVNMNIELNYIVFGVQPSPTTGTLPLASSGADEGKESTGNDSFAKFKHPGHDHHPTTQIPCSSGVENQVISSFTDTVEVGS